AAPDTAGIPMHVLQTAIAIVGWSKTEIGLHAGTPSLGKIFHAQMAFEQIQLQVETHHNMEVIGDLVGIRADQGSLHLVDRTVEGLEAYLPELVGERIPQSREKMFPEGAAAAHHILPKPRLTLVDTRRGSRSKRRSLKRR